jgi:hypothetical protein
LCVLGSCDSFAALVRVFRASIHAARALLLRLCHRLSRLFRM